MFWSIWNSHFLKNSIFDLHEISVWVAMYKLKKCLILNSLAFTNYYANKAALHPVIPKPNFMDGVVIETTWRSSRQIIKSVVYHPYWSIYQIKMNVARTMVCLFVFLGGGMKDFEMHIIHDTWDCADYFV